VSGISRVMVTDEETGGLLEVVEPRYRPSRRLDEAIRLRDLACRFPGCRRNAVGRASGVDLDHTVPWPAGDTSAANLAALCRHHHRLKHPAEWKLSSRPDAGMDNANRRHVCDPSLEVPRSGRRSRSAT
jgi:hypothetical protein